MDSRARLTATLAGTLAVLAGAFVVLYGMNGGTVQPAPAGKPPAALGKLKPTPARPPAPAVQFTDRSGATKTLADFKGHVVLVNLWATWCPPCVKELPSLARAQKALAGRVTIVPVDMEKLSTAKLTDFLASHHAANLTFYQDKDYSVMRGFEANVLPVSILIGADGREIGRVLGGEQWDDPAALAYLRALAPPAASP